MASERTLSIIKPDATRRNLTGQINARFEEAGLRIVGQRRIRLTPAQAEAFYAVHRERPFYRSLCDFMTSGPVVVQVLEGENAIEKNREVMGATDPAKAAPGTIRKDFAESIEANSVDNARHGSEPPRRRGARDRLLLRRSPVRNAAMSAREMTDAMTTHLEIVQNVVQVATWLLRWG
jgi:nucleoside-diphosphate kinase